MSFFSSLHQIVTSSVANLNLSPKRFSLSKEPGPDGDETAAVLAAAATATSSRSASTGSVSGIPRIVTPQGSGGGGGGPRSSGPRRTGSFRQISQPRNPLAFCRRRNSWPEIDQTASSGVHETDGSFFEKYSSLQWKLDQRRLQMIKDSRQDECPPPEHSVGVKPPPVSNIQPKEMEHLYMDVLYTIKYKVGADTELSAHRDQLYVYAQKAFDVTPEQHRRYMAIVHEEKPPIVVLHVTVVEAEGLEAKDANGFSDPYCMLGIQPGTVSPQPGSGLPPSPANSPSPYQPPLSPRPAHTNARTLSEGGIEFPDGRHDHHDKLRKHHSFRLSFKRKERGGGGSGVGGYGCREHRDSISAVPARFIQATSVRRETLNPKWGENFMFDIDDVTSDILHLDIWDHDDESSVLDAVSKLNEVRGVKGLGRFFKQIAQSARSGSQDDFLGCINIPIQDVPSTGLDKWYQLEARSQRSNIQGSIRLKLWLSTREDHGQACTQNHFDNWTDVRRHERLLTIFADYEMSLTKSSLWNGELCHEATSILHQHAVQSGVSELQLAVIRWLAFSHIPSIDPQFLLKQLSQLEAAWGEQTLTGEEEDWLADSFNVFLDYSLQLIRKYRKLFPPHHHVSMNRLEYILRCLSRLSLSKAYGKCCPFNKDIRGEIGNALRVGTHEWYDENKKFTATGQHDPETRLKGFVKLVTAVLIDLQKGVEHYNVLFENINGVFYYAAIYKQHEKLLAKGFSNHLDIIIEVQIVQRPEPGNSSDMQESEGRGFRHGHSAVAHQFRDRRIAVRTVPGRTGVYQVSRTPERVRLHGPVGPVLLPLVRTGPGKVAGPGQIEDRPAREESSGTEHHLPRGDDRETLDVQQRRGHGTVSHEGVLETPRLAGPDTVLQLRVEITGRHVRGGLVLRSTGPPAIEGFRILRRRDGVQDIRRSVRGVERLGIRVADRGRDAGRPALGDGRVRGRSLRRSHRGPVPGRRHVAAGSGFQPIRHVLDAYRRSDRHQDASAAEKVHFPLGLVAGHAAHHRRHRAAPRIPRQPSDRAQHEPDTEELPQGVERRVGGDRLRAGPSDGRRQRRHKDVRLLRATLRSPGTAGGVLPRRRQRAPSGSPDRKRLQGRQAEAQVAQDRHGHVDRTVLRRPTDGATEGQGSQLRRAVREGVLPPRLAVRGGAESPRRHTVRPERFQRSVRHRRAFAQGHVSVQRGAVHRSEKENAKPVVRRVFRICRLDGPVPARVRHDTVHRHGPRRDHVQRFRRRGVSFAQLHTGRPRPVAARPKRHRQSRPDTHAPTEQRSSDFAHPGSQTRGQGGARLREETKGPHRQLLKSTMSCRDDTYRVLRLGTRRTGRALTAAAAVEIRR